MGKRHFESALNEDGWQKNMGSQEGMWSNVQYCPVEIGASD